ncbi:hypothetical protein P5V15_013387 [Pogonomyrmex californicus]
MSSSTISRQVLICLILALLSQYADARRSQYLDTILASLQRLENMLIKQAEQNTLNCLVPAEKLFNILFSDHLQTSSNESNETSPRKPYAMNSVILRRLDLQNELEEIAAPTRHRRKSKNHNENTNVNTNLNTNINANRYKGKSRRVFDDIRTNNKNTNVNFNTNTNKNINRDDMFDISDEDDEV